MSCHHSVYRGSMETYEEKLLKSDPINKATPFTKMNLSNVNTKPRYKMRNTVGDCGSGVSTVDPRLTGGFNYNLTSPLNSTVDLNENAYTTDEYIKNMLHMMHLKTKFDDDADGVTEFREHGSSEADLPKTSSEQSFKDNQSEHDTLLISNSLNLMTGDSPAGKQTDISASKVESLTKPQQQTDSCFSMDMVMFAALVFGLLISKCLQYLQLYIVWFKKQTIQLRNAFVGEISFWDILALENSRFSYRTKLLLIPVIGLCTIVSGVVTVILFTTRMMLYRVPNGMLHFLRRLSVDV